MSGQATQTEIVRPDERAFRDHVEGAAFRSGVARGRWRLVDVHWPHAIFAVSAVPREGAPDEYGFRFNLAGYPQQAPTAQPWDLDRGAPLAHSDWPGGGAQSRVALAFNPGWKGGQALYLPCDREALPGHSAWLTLHPDLLWTPDKTITFFLQIIYDLLHSSGYRGTRRA